MKSGSFTFAPIDSFDIWFSIETMSETKSQYENVLSLIEKNASAEDLAAVQKAIYGDVPETFEIPKQALEISQKEDFEIRAFALKKAKPEEKRKPRIVRVAAVQHPIYRPTTDRIVAQYKALEDKVGQMIDAAALCGTNVLCLQEAWTCPFFFCTREKHPWLEFAESAEHGESVKFLQAKAKKHNMVIISPILEIDENHADTIWNTVVVISNRYVLFMPGIP